MKGQEKIIISGKKYNFSCPYRKQCKKKRIEFSKIAVVFITIFCMGCVAANYILAFMNAQNINSEVTIMLVSTILGTVLGYFLKSLGEKHSRNKHLKKEYIEDISGDD